MSGDHNMHCSGNQPDAIERMRARDEGMKFDLIELRNLATDVRYSTVRVASNELLALIDEIERLRALCASQQADDVQCLGNNS